MDALNLTAAVPAGQLQGRSLLPLLRAPAPAPSDAAAFSQLVRSDHGNCTPPGAGAAAGDASDSDPPAQAPRLSRCPSRGA